MKKETKETAWAIINKETGVAVNNRPSSEHVQLAIFVFEEHAKKEKVSGEKVVPCTITYHPN